MSRNEQLVFTFGNLAIIKDRILGALWGEWIFMKYPSYTCVYWHKYRMTFVSSSHQWHRPRHWHDSSRHQAGHSAGEQRRFLQDEPPLRHPRHLFLQGEHLGLGHLQVYQTLSWPQTRWVLKTVYWLLVINFYLMCHYMDHNTSFDCDMQTFISTFRTF